MKLKNIVILEHRAYYQSIYGLNLNLYIGLNIFVARTIKQATEYIATNACEFAFVDNTAYSDDMAQKLYKNLDMKNSELPIFIIGETSLPHNKFHVFDKNISLKQVIKDIAKTMNVTANDMATLDFGEYYPLQMDFFVPGWFSSTSLYSHTKNEDSYDEILLPDSVVSESFIDELEERSIDQIYVKSVERLKFVNSLTIQIKSKLNDPNTTDSEIISLTATAHQVVMEQARNVGITDNTIELANESINKMQELVEKADNLNSVLNRLLTNTSSFMYQNSFLTNYIGTHLIKKMPWSSKEQQEKLSFVCFFHDISLKSDEFARIHSSDQLEKSNLCAEDKKIIENHALLSAKIVSHFPQIPSGVDIIIKQHHGARDGQGFNKLYSAISPLAAIFIIAEEVSHMILSYSNSEQKINKKELILQLTNKYKIKTFSKIIPYLNDLTL